MGISLATRIGALIVIDVIPEAIRGAFIQTCCILIRAFRAAVYALETAASDELCAVGNESGTRCGVMEINRRAYEIGDAERRRRVDTVYERGGKNGAETLVHLHCGMQVALSLSPMKSTVSFFRTPRSRSMTLEFEKARNLFSSLKPVVNTSCTVP